MSPIQTALLTRRSRIIVPFLFAYGLGLYLVAGAVGDAFSGQSQPAPGDVVIAEAVGGPGQPNINASDTATAVRAAEKTRFGGKRISVVSTGVWTASDYPSDGAPAPEAGAGVALLVELPEPVDLDLSAEPDAALLENARALSGAAASRTSSATSPRWSCSTTRLRTRSFRCYQNQRRLQRQPVTSDQLQACRNLMTLARHETGAA